MTRNDRVKIVRRVISTAGLGPLAEKLGISKQAISKWPQIPAARVVAIEVMTGIPREQLRPDIFGR